MTYSVSLTGHGASAEDAKGVFEDTVRALRKINAEGTDPIVSGGITGSAGDGTPFSMQASEVQDLEDSDDVDEVEDDAVADPE